MKTPAIELPVSTPDGKFVARYSEKGLAELNFPNKPTPSKFKELATDAPAKIRAWHRATEAALKAHLAGKPSRDLPPLDLAGTEFQQNVWREMRKISYGRTKSYGEIAQAIGKPKAVRAVGGACGANPIPIFVPCHRVLAANKKIGGFSGGLGWKRKLLELEGTAP